MSTEANTILMERAADMIDLWEGKMPAKLIEKALDENDLDALYKYVKDAESLAAQEEFHGYNAI
jgi:hypothetical protein